MPGRTRGRRVLLVPAVVIGLLGLAVDAGADSGRVQRTLARVDPQRIADDVLTLAALGSRFALDPGFEAATRLVARRMREAGLQTELDPFPVADLEVSNVVGRVPGPAGRPVILVTAHYDSIAFPLDAAGATAPGAEDNASGTAGLLELGRVLAAEPLATEVRLVALAAEEEGLWGSRHLAQAIADGEHPELQAAINLDMIGYDPRDRRRVVLDAARPGRALAARLGQDLRRYSAVQPFAGIFTRLRSDHLPLVELGTPALTLAAADHATYPHYHTARDLPEHVDAELVAGVVRGVAARVLLMAGWSDGPPVARAGPFVDGAVGAPVRLSGASSFDPRGQRLRHEWAQLDGPPAEITADGAHLGVVPAEAGSYRFQLVVATPDGRRSEPDLTAVVVEDSGCSIGRARGPAPLAPGALLVALGLLVRVGLRGRRPPRRRPR